ncbi:hypothetical protein J7J66_12770, partial [Lysobacter sp. ISL-54]|nr:hypothetical protein [Lysobacter sp. ISL-54]
GNPSGNALTQLVEVQRCGVAVNSDQIGGCASRDLGDKQLDQLELVFFAYPTTTYRHFSS